MKVVGFITEYNPFHQGHKYHMEKSKEVTNAKFSIAVMSGSFVQRGEPSFIDKWTKAKIAVDNGVDLVLELPIIFSTQSAERFAYGGVKILDSLNIVDYITFGSEIGKIEPLKEIAKVLIEEPKSYKNSLEHYLKEGNSFSVSRSNALGDYFREKGKKNSNLIPQIINSPNNILGIEYLKALYKLNSPIKPVTLRRIGSDYTDENLKGENPSATAIRKGILKNNLYFVKDKIPPRTYYHLSQYLDMYERFNCLENYSQLLLYLLRTMPAGEISKFMDVEVGLENRITNMAFKYNSITEIINEIVSKRHTKTRIQRILIHMLLGLKKCDYKSLSAGYPQYLRVLATNNKGIYLLRKIKENSEIPIINKFSHAQQIKKPSFQKMLSYDKRGTDIFFLGLDGKNRLANKDFYTTPYIKV